MALQRPVHTALLLIDNINYLIEEKRGNKLLFIPKSLEVTPLRASYLEILVSDPYQASCRREGEQLLLVLL